MAKNPYPSDEGWMLARITLKKDELINVDQFKNMCSSGKPDEYEFPVMEQNGMKLKIIYRQLPEVAARNELKLLTSVCGRACCFVKEEVSWRKKGNFYIFEAWKHGRCLGGVEINSLHINLETEEVIREAWKKLLLQVNQNR